MLREPLSRMIEIMPDQTIKEDDGKLKLTLVPPEIIFAIARVREYGCKKYSDPDNWKKVTIDRYWEAFLRHTIAAWNDIYARDSESGLLHIDHAACNLDFIMSLMKGGGSTG